MHDVCNWEWSQNMFVFTFLYWCLVIHLIIYVFAFLRWVVYRCKADLSHTLLMTSHDLLPVKYSYVMVDCSFSLALCTENKCFSTIYYVLVGYENLGIPLSDTGKSMVEKKPEGHPLIIKLLLSLWLLYKNYINYYHHHLFSFSVYIKTKEHIIYNTLLKVIIRLYTRFQAKPKPCGNYN